MEFSCPENVWALTICWEQKEEIFACFKFGDTSVFSRLLIIIVVVVIVLVVLVSSSSSSNNILILPFLCF